MKKPLFSKPLRHTEIDAQAVLGLTWYTEEEWAIVKASAVDPDRFEATYPEWHAMANEVLTQLQLAGHKLVKVYIVADALLAWCFLHRMKNDAATRSQYVSERVQSSNKLKNAV